MNYIFIGKGKAKDVLRTFAKLVVADRLLEAKFGKWIEPIKNIERN
jgi:hypothetical protein